MGISIDKLRDLYDWQNSSAYSDDERLVLELTDAMSATPARVTPELRQRLQARFTTAQLIELGTAIAWENYRARYNRIFGFESEDFMSRPTLSSK